MTDNEIFFFRDESGPIIYAPLKGFSARVNDACIEAVEHRLSGEKERTEDKAVLEYLDSFGLFDRVELLKRNPTLPTELTLFPSDGCNLGCIYCYADCKEIKHIMPLQMGKTAIDHIIKKAKEKNDGSVVIKFHGNGEPFTAFDVVKELSRYAKEKAAEQEITVILTVVSNGFWNKEILSWVIEEIDDISVSFDGNMEVQNLQRPTLSGKESYTVVDNVLRKLSEHKKSFGIKVTVTAGSISKIVDIAEHISNAYPGCRWVQFEPVWNTGRFSGAVDKEFDHDLFAEEFIRADKLYGDRIHPVYATADIDNLRICHCEASNDQMILTAQGLISACYEVYDRSDPRSDVFVYGRYEEKSDSFIFNEKKRISLHDLNIYNRPYCKDCFCKYHCAGDCSAKLCSGSGMNSFNGSERCNITRKITAYMIGKGLPV